MPAQQLDWVQRISRSGHGLDAGAGGTGAGGMGAGVAVDSNLRQLLLRDEGLSALTFVDLANAENNWSQPVPSGRALQLVGGRRVLLGTANGYEERSIDDGSFISEVSSFAGTETAHRLHNGNTLLAGVNFQGGQGVVLLEVSPAGSEVRRLEFAELNYVRLVRELADGHWLITSDALVLQSDAGGNIVWQATVQDHAEPHAWEALRLESGEVLVSAGYAASLQIFGEDAALRQTITGGAQEVNPYFFADVQVLPSGNFVVANWQGHAENLGTSGIQLLEYDRAGNLVWYWQQDPSLVSSLQHLIVLDGLDPSLLHVESPTTGVLEPVPPS